MAAAEAGRQLQVGQRFDPVVARGDVATARSRRQCLGEAADVDHPRQPIERGQPRCRLQFEVGEDVVLDDDQFAAFGQAQQAVRGVGRKHRAGRVVQAGIGDVQPRRMRLQGLRERLQVRAAVRVRHADGLHLVRFEQRVVIEVARVIDQHAVAGLEQETAEQIDRVRTGFGQQDLLHGYIDAERGAAPLQQLAQRGQPERAGVVDQMHGIGTRQPTQAAAHAVVIQPVAGHPAASRLEVTRRGFQRLPRHPQRIHRAVQPGFHLGQCKRRPAH